MKGFSRGAACALLCLSWMPALAMEPELASAPGPVLESMRGMSPESKSAPAPELGRLFTTEAQRRALQALKADAPPAGKPVVDTVPAAPPGPAPEPLPVLRGIVYRQDGRHTVWLQDRGYYLPESTQLAGGWQLVSLRPDGLRLARSPGDAAKPRTLHLEMTRRAALPFTSLPAARSGTRQ